MCVHLYTRAAVYAYASADVFGFFPVPFSTYSNLACSVLSILAICESTPKSISGMPDKLALEMMPCSGRFKSHSDSCKSRISFGI